MTMDQLREGQQAHITAVHGEDAITVRLMEMGLIDGEPVELVGFAPLGDPVEYRVGGYRLSLRKSEAGRVEVIPA